MQRLYAVLSGVLGMGCIAFAVNGDILGAVMAGAMACICFTLSFVDLPRR